MSELIRKKAVQKRLGDVSAMHVWRLTNDPSYARLNFPRPRYIGKNPFWVSGEIDQWLESLPTKAS